MAFFTRRVSVSPRIGDGAMGGRMCIDHPHSHVSHRMIESSRRAGSAHPTRLSHTFCGLVMRQRSYNSPWSRSSWLLPRWCPLDALRPIQPQRLELLLQPAIPHPGSPGGLKAFIPMIPVPCPLYPYPIRA